MVVWQGITEGGTAVPVQITEDGKVVAIGEAGPPGPPGPAGPAEWPPNPIEGAFLVWLNGEPTWYAEQPIPIPGDFIGPIIDVPAENTFTVAAPIPNDIFYSGRRVLKADSTGTPIYGNWNQNFVWSTLVNLDGVHLNYTPERMFDATGYGCIPMHQNDGGSGRATFVFPNTGNGVVRLTGDSVGSSSTMTVNGVAANFDTDIAFTDDMTLVWTAISSTAYHLLGTVTIDGLLLVDEGIPNLPAAKGIVSSVFNNSLLLTRVEGEIGIGDYLLAEPAQMAAWLATKRGLKAQNPPS